MSTDVKIILPGGAGLVGQNLVVFLKQQGYKNIVVIDKHSTNLGILSKLHPDITCVDDDLSKPGHWQAHFRDADIVVMLQAQIGAKDQALFIANNITSTQRVLDAAKKLPKSPYIIHISSSVVESIADDNYIASKKQQEQMVCESGLKYCVLRPTLMFGWFDRKHLGWLSRFMKRMPIFPIPGDGHYMRQPLYVGDFCNIIVRCISLQPDSKTYNITGREQIDYIDIIRAIRAELQLHTVILNIPYVVFWLLLKTYAVFSSDPPFTVDQLKALTTCDEFELIPWGDIFAVTPTPFHAAIQKTFSDEQYAHVVLDF